MSLSPQFGINVDPATDELAHTLERTQFADENGIDLVTIQDHPYNRRFVDTLTLITHLAARTQHVRLGTNVANLPLRPPVMLAKQAAAIDVLSGGRFELGLGAGAFWQAINAFGAPTRTPAEAYAAFSEAISILRGLWDTVGKGFTYKGDFYQVNGAQFGPAPAHRIPIWVGAAGPKMLRLTGRAADGVLVSSTYEPPERLLEINRLIDEGAESVGRSPDAVRRGYNLMGIVDVGQFGGRLANVQQGIIYGTPREWIDLLTRYYTDYRQDTFLFWPTSDQPMRQLEAFANEIIPGVRANIAA